MKITDTILVHQIPKFNIHKETVPSVEEIYISVLRKHYIGMYAHGVVLDDDGKEFVHSEVIEEKGGKG